jgi:hypothetical protein
VSDESVYQALRSAGQLVVVEAPAGCGKTHQGAEFARESAAAGPGRTLILTHTHAACSVFAARTQGMGNRLDIRTIDSIVGQVAAAYHLGLGLPVDTAAWLRQRENGYQELAVKVATLLKRRPMIAAALARRHPIIICDEHQDSSGDQHALVMTLYEQGARLRIFSDPMQRIFNDKPVDGSSPPCNWSLLCNTADAFEKLDYPHRWDDGCPDLGKWTLRARELLKSRGRIDLRTGLPASVLVVVAENNAQRSLDFRLDAQERKPVDAFQTAQSSLLVLTRHNNTARALCAVFGRRIPLWEGHTRPGLERLVQTMVSAVPGDRSALATAIVTFMNDVGKGFSPSAFGDVFEAEVAAGCSKPRKGKPAVIQQLARFIVADPTHRGVAAMLQHLSDLKASHHPDLCDVEMDCYREFREAIRLSTFESPDAGLAEITHRRSYARPAPPSRAISTIHKAKGLECASVILMPCDKTTFPDRDEARCLLYVALSRAKSRLMLVVSRDNPSPLFILP